jgi:hypothetical protein
MAKGTETPQRHKSPKAPKKNGRPTKYTKGHDRQALELCLLGATNPELARFFEVATSTVDKWIKEKPSFSGAVKTGREPADAKVAASLYHRALGYSHAEEKIFQHGGDIIRATTTKQYPPDTAAAFIWLKNRRPDLWRDKQEHELTGPEGGPLQIAITRKVVQASNRVAALTNGNGSGTNS